MFLLQLQCEFFLIDCWGSHNDRDRDGLLFQFRKALAASVGVHLVLQGLLELLGLEFLHLLLQLRVADLELLGGLLGLLKRPIQALHLRLMDLWREY